MIRFHSSLANLRCAPLLLALLLNACGPSESAEPPGSLPNLEIRPAQFVAENQPLRLLDDGDTLEIARAPQGGWRLFVAAQIKNLRSQFIHIHGQLRLPDTLELFAEESRQVVVADVPGEPDLKQPDIRSLSQMSHIPLCPNRQSRDVQGNDWVLEVEISEADVEAPRTASGSVRVHVMCNSDPALTPQCECECAANWSAGKCP